MAFLLRSVRKSDYPDLKALGRELNTVNLPSDPKALKKIIQRSVDSFRGKYKKHRDKAQFLFVVEDTRKQRVVGTSKIFARHGTPQRPHVYFEVHREKVASKTLGVNFSRKFYRLKTDTRGYTEIGGLVLDKRHRGHEEKLGKQLSLIRFMYMRGHPIWFKRRVIAELLPPLHEGRPSTLYAFYGFNLTRMPYRQADLLSFKNKEFILKLFPRSDLYFDILPPEVQRDIERTGPGSEVARRLLTKIGFRYAEQIDPFDGGPYYTALMPQIKVYQKTRPLKYVGETNNSAKRPYLILKEEVGEVLGTVTPLKMSRRGMLLPPEVGELLQATRGDKFFIYPWS
ncbi:MAG: arginine N-succinyltransferase [bacterium]|nr:arginine N-succinyltransferase [bacterium]